MLPIAKEYVKVLKAAGVPQGHISQIRPGLRESCAEKKRADWRDISPADIDDCFCTDMIVLIRQLKLVTPALDALQGVPKTKIQQATEQFVVAKRGCL